jgi:hypothetical protein
MDICPKVLFSSTQQILFPKYQQLFDVTLQTDASFTTHQYTAKFWGMLYIFNANVSHDAATDDDGNGGGGDSGNVIMGNYTNCAVTETKVSNQYLDQTYQ